MSQIRLLFVVLFLSLGVGVAIALATWESELSAQALGVAWADEVSESPLASAPAAAGDDSCPTSNAAITSSPRQPIRPSLEVPDVAEANMDAIDSPMLPRADGGLLPHQMPEAVPPLPLSAEPVATRKLPTLPWQVTESFSGTSIPAAQQARFVDAVPAAESNTEANRLRISLQEQLDEAPAAVNTATPATEALAQTIVPNTTPPEPVVPAQLPSANVIPVAAETKAVVPVAQIIPEEGDGQITMEFPNSDIREVLELLSKAGDLNILASPSVQGTVNASLKNVDIETALEAILRSSGYLARREKNFVFVGTAKDFEQMNQDADRIGTRVYRPNYVSATEIQALIAPLLTPQIGTISVSSAADVGIASDASASGGDDFAGNEVLLVRDYESVLMQVDQVMDEVDQRPLQVSIEAMIISVNLSDEFAFGIDFEAFRNKQNARVVGNAPLDNLANINIGANSGLKFGFLDSDLSTFVEALETIGETHVISSPRLMCLNKQRAEIHIGQEEGYVSTTITETAATQTVEFLEVGTQLRLRPFISTDGLVRLEIHPELSTGTVEVSEGFTLPSKTVTQVTTNVMVRDGATLVIGGLLREDIDRDTSQIPLIGNLPVLGSLFRSKTDKTVRDEIIVLITPRIVHEPKFNCEGEYAECEGMQTHAIFADKLAKHSRVSSARRYRRMAQAAWAAGDYEMALRHVNMAIHYEPMNRESAWIRSQILAEAPYTEESIRKHLRTGVWPLPTSRFGTYSEFPVVNPMDGPHTAQGMESAPPADRGTPGPRGDIRAGRPSAAAVYANGTGEFELVAPEQVGIDIGDLPEPSEPTEENN